MNINKNCLFFPPINLSFVSLIRSPKQVEGKFLLPDSSDMRMGWEGLGFPLTQNPVAEISRPLVKPAKVSVLAKSASWISAQRVEGQQQELLLVFFFPRLDWQEKAFVRTSTLGIVTFLIFSLHTFITDPFFLGESCCFSSLPVVLVTRGDENNRVKHTHKTHEPVV